MPVPRHPGKHRHRGVVSGRHFVRYLRSTSAQIPRCAPSVVVGFSPALARFATGELGARRVAGYPRLFEIGRGPRRVAYAEARGVGGPSIGITVEELTALGARRFIIVGFAGALDPELETGTTVICRRALRDEGTSHHYAPAGAWAYPTRELRRALARSLARRGIEARTEDSWTIDAPYRETAVEVRRFRREGVRTVEMEASALFVIARSLGVEAAALFTISDQVTERGWTPAFAEAGPSLERLFGATVAAIRDLPGPRAVARRRARGRRRRSRSPAEGKAQ